MELGLSPPPTVLYKSWHRVHSAVNSIFAMFEIRGVVLLLLYCLTYVQAAPKVACYWDGRSFNREGAAKVTVEEIKAGLSYCTHLVYGYAKLDDDDYKIEPLDEDLALDKGKGQYRAVTSLKRQFPGLKVLLSLGGFGDNDDLSKYLDVLETESSRTTFINSVRQVMNQFDFDGIDLSWKFPVVKEKKERGIFGSILKKAKDTLGIGIDEKAAEHRDQFVLLVRELKSILRADGDLVTLGVMPHVNTTAYYDVRSLMPYVDFVNLWTFDFRTPKRTKTQADYSAPLYYMYDRNPQQNVDAVVKWWLEQGAEPNKLVVALPTFGRTWKLTTDSGHSGDPPLVADGAGEEGTHSKIKGTLAYYEICTKIVSPTNANAPAHLLRRIPDANKRLGTYAYRLQRPDHDQEGFWVSFEEPETAAQKANYVKTKGLGGIAVVDMSLDDARGVCDGSKFPILKSAKINL